MSGSKQKLFFNRVIEHNTYFFHSDDFEKISEAHVKTVSTLILQLKDHIEEFGLKVDTVANWIIKDKNALLALLTITGLSRETFLRLLSFIRIKNDSDLNSLVNRSHWPQEKQEFREWSESTVLSLLSKNEYFRDGIIKLFFYGASKEAISRNLPLFEYYKLSKDKLKFSPEALIDTIVRYKYKGAYSADARNNPENLIIKLLNEENIPYERGKMAGLDRQMDFIIPDRKSPKIIVESSYVVTTASGQGDKAKTEQGVARNIKESYPNALFVGFLDGLGWLVRRGDLMRMAMAYDDVFTFRNDELDRFRELVLKACKGNENGR
jgi:hypothetical protein